jgi:hypothetical protein
MDDIFGSIQFINQVIWKQKIETIDQPRSEAAAAGQLKLERSALVPSSAERRPHI